MQTYFVKARSIWDIKNVLKDFDGKLLLSSSTSQKKASANIGTISRHLESFNCVISPNPLQNFIKHQKVISSHEYCLSLATKPKTIGHLWKLSMNPVNPMKTKYNYTAENKFRTCLSPLPILLLALKDVDFHVHALPVLVN